MVAGRRFGREREIDSDELKAGAQLEEQRRFRHALHVKRDQLLDPEKIKPEAPAIQTNEWSDARLGRGAAGPQRTRSVQLRAAQRDFARQHSIGRVALGSRETLDNRTKFRRDTLRSKEVSRFEGESAPLELLQVFGKQRAGEKIPEPVEFIRPLSDPQRTKQPG